MTKQLTESDLYVQGQVEGQSQDHHTSARRYLSFEPFEEALATLSRERYSAIEQLVFESGVKAIQKHVKDEKLTYEELTLYYIKRIKEIDNRQLNAVMQLNSEAIHIARAQDKLRKEGKLTGELQGIPVLLKDNIGTGDTLYNTAGASVLATSSCPRDSYIVKKLKEAGAIILGKANMSEWANFMSSNSLNGYSTLGGQTHNPYGPYDVGGSSSGSAVAAAANLTTLAIGTETTGSILSPSSQNNVVGIKPTVGLWSRDLVIPIAHDLDTAGPIGRTVEDVAILLGLLVGQDEADPFTLEESKYKKTDYTFHLRLDGLQGKRIGLVTNQGIRDNYRTGEREVIDRIMGELESLGAEVVPIQVNEEALQIQRRQIFNYEYKHGVEAYLNEIGEGAPVKTIEEIAAYNDADIHNRALFDQAHIEASRDAEITVEENQKLVDKNARLTSEAIDNALEEHNLDLLMSLYVSLSGLYAAARYPAIIVPAGCRQDGEPVGLCLVSAKYREDLLIESAYAYEQGTHYRQQLPIKEMKR